MRQSRAILDELPLLLRQELACAMNTGLFAKAVFDPRAPSSARFFVIASVLILLW